MAADSGATVGARLLMILAVIFGLAYACADRAEESKRTPTPSISTEVTR